jgi:putative oxidoreductase
MIATFGASKLFTEDGAQMDIDIIRQIGFEPPKIWASFVIWLEFLGGIAIAIGLLTRPFAAMFVGLFGVILITVMIPRGVNYQLFALWFAAFFYIALRGGGGMSLDRLIGRELRPRAIDSRSARWRSDRDGRTRLSIDTSCPSERHRPLSRPGIENLASYIVRRPIRTMVEAT